MNFAKRVCSSVFAALVSLSAASPGHAQIIDLYGDLGTGTTLGTPFSPVNSTFTQSFSQSTLAGNITGDVIVSNDPTGSIFDMTITNLTYNCIIPNGSGFGDVTVQVLHTYVTGGGGSYTGSQSMAGTWTSGPLSVVQLDSIQDYTNTNVFLPSLVATSSPFTLGPVSGTPMVKECKPERPISVLAFHGTADPVVGYEGGGTGTFPKVSDVFADWGRRDRCSDGPHQTFKNGAVTCQSYELCADGTVDSLCTIDQGKHDWPGSSDGTKDIQATAELLRFFAKHTR